MGKTTDETGAEILPETETGQANLTIEQAATIQADHNAAATPDAPKPVVNYGVASIELHLISGGRAILMSKKTLAIKLSRDPALEYADPNVRLVLAMAAGPDFVDAFTDADGSNNADLSRAYAKATGQ